MLAPVRERCGIGDYSRRLIEALRDLPGIAAVEAVPTPEGAARVSTTAALQHYLADERLFATLGRRLNSTDVAHIQHQYFFFGGVAPHKNHFRALLNAVQTPLVLTVHEIATGIASAWKRALVDHTNRGNFLHPAIRQIIVHTDVDAARLRALGVTQDRLTVLPIAVPAADPLPDRNASRAAFDVTGKRVLLMFGFLSAKKGHFLALEALERLPGDVVLLFAGEQHPDDPTDYVARLKAAIAAKGLEQRARITGYLPQDRIPQVMASADLALTPFLETSGSASLAHLLAYGVPVLASDIAPHRELLAQTPGSLRLFPSEDITALRTGISTLLEDPVQLSALREGAHRFAVERSFMRVAEETLAVYRRAMRP